jgi:hypothetical protein
VYLFESDSKSIGKTLEDTDLEITWFPLEGGLCEKRRKRREVEGKKGRGKAGDVAQW